MDHEALRARIINRLKELNLSIASAEKKASLGKGCLYSICHGHTKSPSIQTLDAIAKVLDYDLSELLDIRTLQGREETLKPFNLPLYNSIIEVTTKFVLEKNLVLDSKTFLSFAKDIYYHCLSKKLGILDAAFANEYLQTEVEKVNSKKL